MDEKRELDYYSVETCKAYEKLEIPPACGIWEVFSQVRIN
jgi:hypothetical protein